jgi:hypothetical protein
MASSAAVPPTRSRIRRLARKLVTASVVLALPAAALGFFSTYHDASAGPGVQSLWSATAPRSTDSPDSAGVNVGMRFHATVAGQILGIRFFKGTGNVGTHVGSLWSASGMLLDSVTFATEAPTGWQTATFTRPIDIAAFTTYEASYLAPHGHYAYSNDYFKAAHQSGDLIADQATSQVANGVYEYADRNAAPVNASPNASNYWVDVLFRPSSGANSSLAPHSAPRSGSVSPSPSTSASEPPSGTTPVGGYVRPGTVGYLGNVSALKVYQPDGAAPGGCSWQPYGLRCNQYDLTLDHVWIKGSLYWTGTGRLTITQSIVQGGTADSWYAILGHPATAGAIDSTIEVTDSTVGWLPGRTMPAGEDVAPIWSVYGNQALVAIRDDLSGMPQGIDPTDGSVIRDNWIHDLVQTGSASDPEHLDGIFSQGGDNITIEGNYVDVPVRSDATAAIYIQHRGATDTGISIVGNYLNGGAYNLRNQTGIAVDVRNNTFAGSVWGTVGDLTGYPGTYGNWSGNITLDQKALTAP